MSACENLEVKMRCEYLRSFRQYTQELLSLLDEQNTINCYCSVGVSNIIVRSKMASEQRKNGKELRFCELFIRH